MKFSFDTYEEYQSLWGSVHSAILYWKKVKQDAQGKICLQVDGTQTHYDVEEAEKEIANNARLLKSVEDSTHPEWNSDTECYEVVDGVDFYSSIVYSVLKSEVSA